MRPGGPQTYAKSNGENSQRFGVLLPQTVMLKWKAPRKNRPKVYPESHFRRLPKADGRAV